MPLVWGLLDLSLGTIFQADQFLIWDTVLYVGITVLLIRGDRKQLKNNGTPVGRLGRFFFVPGYLFLRAKLTKQSQVGLIGWLAAVLLSVSIAILGTLVFGQVVNSSYVETGIKDWLLKNQLADKAGLTVVCPDQILTRTGSVFNCEASSPTLGALTYQVTVSNSQGDVTWQLVNY